MAAFADSSTRPALDESLYTPDEEQLTFFRSQTGINDEQALKEHIIRIQRKAYEIHGYPCIRNFAFTRLKISRMPAYERVLALGREREGALLLDIGCCFGNDIRKAASDGFPIQNMIASDLRQEFWDLGHELFRSTVDSFPVTFVAGDAFDPKFLEPHAPFYDAPQTGRPDLSSLTSLTPLQGHLSIIHASAFFHLFDEEQQFRLAKSVAGLLSPVPGSMIFGSHGGAERKGKRPENLQRKDGRTSRGMFCHSPESWQELWDGQVFEKGTVKVEAHLGSGGMYTTTEWRMLFWSVTRL